jgi:hypothetical protein
MGFQLSTCLEELLFGEHSTMKVVSCVRGGVIVYRWPLWWFTLWRMSAVRVRLSPARDPKW